MQTTITPSLGRWAALTRRSPLPTALLLPGATALLVALALAVSMARGELAAAWPLLLVAPWAEELLFRAGLQDGLRRARVAPGVAIVLTALAFALLHGLTRSWPLAAWVFGPALLLGGLYQRQGRVAPCALLHAACNAVWVIAVASGLPVSAFLKF